MINWDRVNELRDEVGSDDFDEVVEIFLEEVEEVIERLREKPDPLRFEEDLHFLKGGALNLGFKAFSDICQTGETDAANGQGQNINIPAVIASYENSKSCFLTGAQNMKNVA